MTNYKGIKKMEKQKIKMIGLSVLAILVLIVLLQNTEVVAFQFLFWKISMSRIILFLLMMIAGMVGGFFIGRKSKKN